MFIDFDGVLHPAGGAPGYVLPFEWLPQLEELLSAAPDVALVVHSSWALRYSLEELCEFLGPVSCKVIGTVGPGSKEDAILAFLRSRPEIDSWLVVDDSPGDFSDAFSNSIAVCDPKRGVSDPGVQARILRWVKRGA